MAGWVRLDSSIDTHPDVLDAGPWGLVAFTTLLRIAKEQAAGGAVSAKHVTGKHLARRALFDPGQFSGIFEEALQALVTAGLVVVTEDGVRLPGWTKYQEDSTNATRQQAYRDKKRPEVAPPLRAVTSRDVTDGDAAPVDVTPSNAPVTLRNASNGEQRAVTRVTTDRTGQDNTGQDKNTPPPPSLPEGGEPDLPSADPLGQQATRPPESDPVAEPSPRRKRAVPSEAEQLARAAPVVELWRRILVPLKFPDVKPGAWSAPTAALVAKAAGDLRETEALLRRVAASEFFRTKWPPDIGWVLSRHGRERIENGRYDRVGDATAGDRPWLDGVDLTGLTPDEAGQVEHDTLTYGRGMGIRTAHRLRDGHNGTPQPSPVPRPGPSQRSPPRLTPPAGSEFETF